MTSVDYNWNIFRYIADYLHLFGIVIVIATLLWNRNCRGLSFKTQVFYLVIFCTRYLDLVSTVHTQSWYLIVFKLFYICSSVLIVFLMRRWDTTIETNKDTCSIPGILIPCIVFAVVSVAFSSTYTFPKLCWVFSEILEGFAMLPQYIFNYRQDVEMKRRDNIGVLLFILALGFYRMFYAANWIYKKVMMGSTYTDFVSWFAGIVEIILFLDYLFNKSFLKLVVLKVDSKINDLVELKILHTSQTTTNNGSISPMRAKNLAEAKRLGAPLDEDDEAMLII